jgi:hypothetical protein
MNDFAYTLAGDATFGGRNLAFLCVRRAHASGPVKAATKAKCHWPAGDNF